MSKTENIRTAGEALAAARRRLAARSDSPTLDAELLLGHILDLGRVQLLARPERALNTEQIDAWEAALRRLEAGEALPYLLGQWEFFGLSLAVTSATLIPRSETELLVETALDWLRAHPQRRRVADVGTGSGAIAVALAHTINDLQMTAVDLSAEALEVARSNVQRHELGEQVTLVDGDLLDGVAGSFDLICANLPYIPTARLVELAVARREPLRALDGGPDGLELIGRLLAQAVTRLVPGGLLLAEVDDSHEKSAAALAQEHFPEATIEVRPDLAGKPRLLVVQT